MVWVKTDDKAPLHTKFLLAGVSAYGWWHAGLSYCNRELTDGFIPGRAVGLIFPGTAHDEVLRITEALCREGSLHVIDADRRADCSHTFCRTFRAREGGYLMHDYPDHQPRRKKVLAHRRLRSVAGRQGGVKSAESRKQSASTMTKHGAVTPTNPDPTRPDPTGETSSLPPQSPHRRRAAKNGAPGFLEFYALYPRHAAPDAAERAWRAATSKASPDVLMSALRNQVAELRARPKDRIPYPATWLNGGHWKNEASPPSDANGNDPYAGLPTLFDCRTCGDAHETRECPQASAMRAQ